MLNNVNSVISSQLAKLIKERKLKDADVLRKCGFTRPTLNKIKNEGNINVETLVALATGLGVKVSFFLDEDIVVEEYNAHGEKAMAVKHIDLVDQRSVTGSEKLTSDESDDVHELKNKISRLQQELLDARAEIINLMKGEKK